MTCGGRGNRSNRLRRCRQGNGLHNHLLDLRLVPSKFVGYKGCEIHRRTSKASISSEAASFEGAERLCCDDIRVIRSQTCWSVGALVTDARWRGDLVPGGSILPGSTRS